MKKNLDVWDWLIRLRIGEENNSEIVRAIVLSCVNCTMTLCYMAIFVKPRFSWHIWCVWCLKEQQWSLSVVYWHNWDKKNVAKNAMILFWWLARMSHYSAKRFWTRPVCRFWCCRQMDRIQCVHPQFNGVVRNAADPGSCSGWPSKRQLISQLVRTRFPLRLDPFEYLALWTRCSRALDVIAS